MLRRLILMTLMSALAALSCAKTVVVHMYNFQFSTDPTHHKVVAAVIHVGDTVRWVLDESFHCSTACAGMTESWASGIMSTVGQTYDHKFTHGGVFGYYCCLHGVDMGNGRGGGMANYVVVLAPLPIQPHAHALIQKPTPAKPGVTTPCPMCDPKRNPIQSNRVRTPWTWLLG